MKKHNDEVVHWRTEYTSNEEATSQGQSGLNEVQANVFRHWLVTAAYSCRANPPFNGWYWLLKYKAGLNPVLFGIILIRLWITRSYFHKMILLRIGLSRIWMIWHQSFRISVRWWGKAALYTENCKWKSLRVKILKWIGWY